MAAPAGWWPTDDQVLLLRAALFEPARASVAWEQWRAGNDVENIDAGSLRLLPLAYRNLSAAGIDEPKLKSAYRAAWLRNQLLFRRATAALQTLAAAGVPTMLLKGGALAVGYYRDGGTRPMGDIDVLVPWRDYERAFHVLLDAGWISGSEIPPRLMHASMLVHPDGNCLDLHRYSIADAVAVDDAIWAASIGIEMIGFRTRALCPTDMLLNVAVHGARWNLIPGIRWLADAVVVERASGGIDWERLISEASRVEATVALAAALECATATVELPVPDGVVDRLHVVPKRRLERWAQRVSLQPGGGGTWLPVVLDQYVRQARIDRSLRFTDLLRAIFGDEPRTTLALQTARKAGEVAFAQSLMRLAPGRVSACEICGRRVVSLRRRTVCVRCAAQPTL